MTGQDPPPDAVLLAGPTASGKTDWALALAERVPLEVVSVDSAQVYRGFDIGSAKPPAELRARVPHHLIDIRDPAETYSAGEFVADAVARIREILGRGRLPLLVGGTMLYFRALVQGLACTRNSPPMIPRPRCGSIRTTRSASSGRSRCCARAAGPSRRGSATPPRHMGWRCSAGRWCLPTAPSWRAASSTASRR